MLTRRSLRKESIDILLLFFFLFLPGTAQAANVLLIVADDVGVNSLPMYGEGSDFPSTPNLDALAAQGVLFRNAWSNPICSPTRATILTGRYSFRTGVGAVTRRGTNPANTLSLAETVIPEVLDSATAGGVAHAAVGKWHLSNGSNGGKSGPNLAGFSRYAGALFNLVDYFNWARTVDGVTRTCKTGGRVPECADNPYATTVNVDDAIDWISSRSGQPWFLYLAFNAAHSPYQAPPDNLHTETLPVSAGTTCSPLTAPRPCYRAQIEAMDTEIGRLLASLPTSTLEQTTILFVGDNGTPGDVTLPPFLSNHAKATIYEGGINVPLLIHGPVVGQPGTESQALVNTTDLFATALEILTGAEISSIAPSGVDSVSLLPILGGQLVEVREHAFAEIFVTLTRPESSQNSKTIRNTKFKLIRFDLSGREELYDLSTDPFESDNILLHSVLDPEQQANYDSLGLARDELLASGP